MTESVFFLRGGGHSIPVAMALSTVDLAAILVCSSTKVRLASLSHSTHGVFCSEEWFGMKGVVVRNKIHAYASSH